MRDVAETSRKEKNICSTEDPEGMAYNQSHSLWLYYGGRVVSLEYFFLVDKCVRARSAFSETSDDQRAIVTKQLKSLILLCSNSQQQRSRT